MREILFRGKRTDNGNWIEGSLIVGRDLDSGDLIYLIAPLSAFYTEIKKVMPESASEFTGLTDKNGKKIFEGDIVYSDDLYAEPLLVIFNENRGEFQVLFSDGYSEGFLEQYTPICHLKVIGNIHDKPELLRTPQNDEVRE